MFVSRRIGHDILCRLHRCDTCACTTGSESLTATGSPTSNISSRRLGQGAFRTLVTDACHRRCAVTGERSLPPLEAAHIRAHAAAGPNRTRNGLLLRADIHRLFDDGHVTVDPELRFVVSPRLHEEFENGRVYCALDGQPLANVPNRLTDRPGREFLKWHNSEVYLG